MTHPMDDLTLPTGIRFSERQNQNLYTADQLREAIKQAVEAERAKQPTNWSVYNSGAEVASGLSFEEAWDYLTPERIARDWCAVCVVDESNLPRSQT